MSRITQWRKNISLTLPWFTIALGANLFLSCSPKAIVSPMYYYALDNITWEDLGEGLILTDSSNEMSKVILMDSVYGINFYDSSGNLEAYYNQPGYQQVAFLSKNAKENYLFTHSAAHSSLVCYDFDQSNCQLTPLVNFSPDGLSHSVAFYVEKTSQQDSLLYWFSGRDSTLSLWSMTPMDSSRFSFNLESHEKTNHVFTDLIHSQDSIYGISSSGQLMSYEEGHSKPLLSSQQKWRNVQLDPLGGSTMIWSNEEILGLFSKNASPMEFQLQMDKSKTKWKLNRVKYITHTDDLWLFIGQFKRATDGNTIYGAILGELSIDR